MENIIQPTQDQTTELGQAQHTWDSIDKDRVRDVSWLAFEDTVHYVNHELLDGRYLHTRIFELLAKKSNTQSLEAAALVCGDMMSEKYYFMPPNMNFAHVDGYDLSPASLERAKEHVPFPFTAHCVDVNTVELPKQKYDLIIGSHGIHHIAAINHLFKQIDSALKPDGILAFYEWIGPHYLQIPATNRFFSVLLLHLLFPSEKLRTTHMGMVKGRKWLQPAPESFDPSEAVNSLEIMPTADRMFEAHTKVLFGGILYPMFEGLGSTIPTQKNWKIRFATRMEKLLGALGLIKPLFAICVYTKKTQQN